MYLRTDMLDIAAIALVVCACGSTTGGGGGTFVAKDVSGDGALSADTDTSDTTGSDGKASDSSGKDGAVADTGLIDAGVTPEQVLQCWHDKCPSNVSACQANATCASVLACVYACPKTDSVCPNKCADPLKSDLGAMGVFASLAKCTKANCDMSNLPPNTCGNGKCEGDEINFCSMDCDTTIGPLSDCVTGKCQADACLLDALCNAALNCMVECTSDSCRSDCTAKAGASQNVFGAVWNCASIDCSVYIQQGSP